MSAYPNISVVIPIYRDLEHLPDCLEHLKQQSIGVKNFNVFLVDNHPEQIINPSSTTGLVIQVLHEPTPGSYAARNHALSKIHSGFIAFTDADCLPAIDWLENGVSSLLNTSRNTIIGGAIEIFPKNRHTPTLAESYDMLLGLRQERFVLEHHFAATANMFTIRSAFDDVGLFNQNMKSGGDTDWGRRAFLKGYNVVYESSAKVYHPGRYTCSELVRKTRRVAGAGGDHHKDVIPDKSTVKDRTSLMFQSLRSVLTDERASVARKIQILGLSIGLMLVRRYERTRLAFGGNRER